MAESFWYMDGDDAPERPAEELPGADLFSMSDTDFSPFHEPMRGERRHMRAPSTDQKRVRRQIHRSGSYWDSEDIKPHERVTDWKSVVGDHDTSDWRIHRTLHIDPMDDPDGFNLWKGMGTSPHPKQAALPDHEVAHRLLKLVTAHPNLGLHWTADESHAVRVGGSKNWGLGHSWYSGQDAPRYESSGLESPVIVHAKWPKTEHIETDPQVLHEYGVKPFDNPDLDEHDEAEVPLKTGAPVEITGLSWSQHTSNRPGEYRHYTFDKPIRHLGMRAQAAGSYDAVDWDELYPRLVEGETIHRGIGVNLPDELHRHLTDESVPRSQRAHALLSHLTSGGGREGTDRRTGLGMHWSLTDRVAENFAEKQAEHYADSNKNEHADHDFSWGTNPGDFDSEKLSAHLHEHHGIHPNQQPESGHALKVWHSRLHQGAPPMPGQLKLFNPEPDPERIRHIGEDPFRGPGEPKGKPGMAIMLHALPSREHIDEDPYSNPNKGGDVYHPLGHGESEVPLRSGASVPITGISWKPVHSFDDEDPEEWGTEEYRKRGGWTHHDFREPEHHEAAKTATVLNTQIERLNQGDQVRTPTGQTVTVQKVRPHETDATKVYLDTDMGTSVVDRGTDFQVVPHNSQQQELPDTGNPMGSGNSGQLPAAGKTPGGAGSAPATAPGSCPNCGNSGTLHLHGANYICSVCGFTVPAGGSPGGLLFTNQPSGYLPGRRQPGAAPRAHVWASKYITTTTQESQIARRARRVSGGDQ